MDEGKLIADFVAHNFDKILVIGKSVFGKIDATVQTKLRTAYTDYLVNTRQKYSKSKSFFIRNQPTELYSYYVPTGISCTNKVIDKPTFNNCIEFTNRLVISGSGGSGKSVLIKHLFLDCIQSKAYVPILIELRDLNNYENSLDQFIKETLGAFGFNTNDLFIEKSKETGNFCFFFDGFDEVTPKHRSRLIKEILSISKKYSECPIFISTRPDDIVQGLDEFSVFKMLPLDLSSALSLVEKLPYEEIIKKKFSLDLSEGLFDQHESFLSNPLLLSIMLLTYGENAEIPSKLSLFYNQAYEALFQRHDARKEGFRRERATSLDIQDFSKVFSFFCLMTYEKRLFKMPRTVCIEYIRKSIEKFGFATQAEDYLTDLLSAACLLIEDGLEIAFSHRSFQEYFVALEIAKSRPEIQQKLIERYWTNMHTDNVMNLLAEIDSDLIERALIVPKLEEFFHEIGVKRNVGVTHLLRLIKYFFSEITVDSQISFTYHRNNSGPKICLIRIIDMTVRKYSDFVIRSKDEIERLNDDLYSKYQIEKKRVEYKTNILTIRSPIFIDINTRGLWFSLEYLTNAYNAFKKLKITHSNSVQNFEALLGIK